MARSRARNRRGLSLLFVLGLLVALSLFAFLQIRLSKSALSQAERSSLFGLVRLQARSALEELHSQVSRDLNDPDTALFRLLDGARDGNFDSIDLTPVLEPPSILIRPRQGRQVQATKPGPEGKVLGFLGVLRSPRRSQDPVGNSEWVAVLTLTVHAGQKGSPYPLTRVASASYELRSARLGLPRPFFGLPLYLGDHRAVLDPVRVEAQRQEILAGQEEVRSLLEELASSSPEAEAKELRAFRQGLKSRAETEEGLSPFPRVGRPLLGPYHVEGAFSATQLDLEEILRQAKQEREEAREALRVAPPGQRVQPAYDLLGALTEEIDAYWRFRWKFSLAEPGTPLADQVLGPYQARLDPAFFEDRVHLRAQPDSVLIQRWLKGRARLNGVLDLRSTKPLRIRGSPAGKVLCLVGPGPLELEELYRRDPDGPSPDPPGELTVVSLGANVTISGEVRASVAMLQGTDSRVGLFRLPSGSLLRGTFLAPVSKREDLELRGAFERPTHSHDEDHSEDSEAPTELDPAAPEPLFVLSSIPLFQAGS